MLQAALFILVHHQDFQALRCTLDELLTLANLQRGLSTSAWVCYINILLGLVEALLGLKLPTSAFVVIRIIRDRRVGLVLFDIFLTILLSTCRY